MSAPLLPELFGQLPEAGDPKKPKLVFFFEEAHLLFNDAPAARSIGSTIGREIIRGVLGSLLGKRR